MILQSTLIGRRWKSTGKYEGNKPNSPAVLGSHQPGAESTPLHSGPDGHPRLRVGAGGAGLWGRALQGQKGWRRSVSSLVHKYALSVPKGLWVVDSRSSSTASPREAMEGTQGGTHAQHEATLAEGCVSVYRVLTVHRSHRPSWALSPGPVGISSTPLLRPHSHPPAPPTLVGAGY